MRRLYVLLLVACHTSRGEKIVGAAVPTIAPPPSATANAPPPPPVCAAIDPKKLELPPLDPFVEAPVPDIAQNETLAPFYEHLAHVMRGTAHDHVRIAMYGDSNMTMDVITGEMRRVLQGKFGDAGHGFVSLVRPWAWYRHQDIEHDFNSSSWKIIATSTNPVGDNHYGLADQAAESLGPGAKSWVKTAEGTPIGTAVSKVDIFYLARPSGGKFSVFVDGTLAKEVSTAASETHDAFEHFEVPDGAHKIECRSGWGAVRLFGASFERGASPASIIVDSLGTGALNYEQMNRVSERSRAGTLARRNYDLVIFLLGTNTFAPGVHEKWMSYIFETYRGVIPKLPLLVMSPPDMELHQEDNHSDPRIVKLDEQFSQIAAKHGVAFWSFWQAMGGDGSMKKFARKKMAEWDLIHFDRPGARLMGDRIVHGLFQGFQKYLTTHPTAGCEARISERSVEIRDSLGVSGGGAP